jgi:hypothetical protein
MRTWEHIKVGGELPWHKNAPGVDSSGGGDQKKKRGVVNVGIN